MHGLSMTASLMLFWLMMSGDFGLLNLALGIASSLLVVAISSRMNVVDHESQPIHLTPRLPMYLGWLAVQVIKSNLAVTRCIWKPGQAISPDMIRLNLSQESVLGKIIYANSVTLTPGTVTPDLRDGDLLVHALGPVSAGSVLNGELDRVICERGRDVRLHVGGGADLQMDPFLAQMSHQARVLDAAHAVADARGLEVLERLPHAPRAPRLAGMRRSVDPVLDRMAERRYVRVNRIARLVSGDVQPDNRAALVIRE